MRNFIILLLLLSFLENRAQINCRDSSFRIRYSSQDSFIVRDHISTTDLGSLMAGRIVDSAGLAQKAVIFRLNAHGGLLWSKKIEIPSRTIILKKIVEQSNGEVIAFGLLVTPVTRDVVIFKMDATGNLIWTKAYNGFPHFSIADDVYPFSVSEGRNGDILVSWQGLHIGSNEDSSYAVISRLNNSGVPVWSRAFISHDDLFTHPSGVFLNGNEVVALGEVSDASTNCGTGNFFAMKLNYTSGNLQLLKTYCYSEISNGSLSNGELVQHYNATMHDNGRFSLFGRLYGYNSKRFFYKVILDNGLNLVKSQTISVPLSISTGVPLIKILSNGQTYISTKKNVAGQAYWAAIDSSDQIIRQKKTFFSSENVSNYSFAQRPDNSISFLTNYTLNSQKYTELSQLQTGDESIISCLGSDTSFIAIQQFQVSPSVWSWKSVVNDPVAFQPLVCNMTDINISEENICKQVSICDSLQITGPDSVCVVGQTLDYIVLKNPQCRKQIAWESDPAATFFSVLQNDSTLRIRFRMPGPGPQSTWLRASLISGCGNISDSIKIVLLPLANPLPADTSICPGQTIRLSPGFWFKNYLWQDGSTDSIFNVSQPGFYSVRLESFCGNIQILSVNVSGPLMTIETDKTKCNLDTILLHAPSGLINYNWAPQTNMLITADTVIKVFPLTTTSYFFSAQTIYGCVIKDTINVTVFHSSPISLGNDTSFCDGDSLTLSTPPSFVSYYWNTGSADPGITVSQAGTYKIQAVDVNGCVSSDSIIINPLLTRPTIEIQPRETVCLGQTDTLRFSGGFAQYHWQDGSVNNLMPVHTIGTYWAWVSTNDGCTATDTVFIKKIALPPSDFLANDTSICRGSSLELAGSEEFTNYLWNNSFSSPKISIQSAGIYVLKVRDQNNCVGIDSVLITLKDCQNKILFPTAFTPNGDNLNDLFRPLVEGVLDQYEFYIYNRWGQLIFDSKIPSQGWNGSFENRKLGTGSYVWMCSYQFRNEQRKTAKGTILLIR